ncbi:MAG: PspA/IM30 family protein, partial [Myxococcota bacterium]
TLVEDRTMNRFRRWSVSIRTRLDDVIGQIENHEAVVDEVIRDVHRAAARARVQLRRVQRDGSQLRASIERDRQAAQEWRNRAATLGTEEESRAIECLRRAKRAERTVTELEERRVEHDRAEKQLTRDVKAIESRLSELRERRNLMRTRQSRAEAVTVVHAPDDSLCSLDDVFDRWDSRITEMELVTGQNEAPDRFEEEFVSLEEEAALREELKSVRAQRGEA